MLFVGEEEAEIREREICCLLIVSSFEFSSEAE